MLKVEVNNQIQSHLDDQFQEYINKISRRHCIPVPVLISDLPPALNWSTCRCRGLVKTGERCTRNGKFSGFCSAHHSQREVLSPVNVQRTSSHTHDLSCGYVKGCPACDGTDEELKDFGSILD
jgi:hypothetical protein